jgi:hypothetical protein
MFMHVIEKAVNHNPTNKRIAQGWIDCRTPLFSVPKRAVCAIPAAIKRQEMPNTIENIPSATSIVLRAETVIGSSTSIGGTSWV